MSELAAGRAHAPRRARWSAPEPIAWLAAPGIVYLLAAFALPLVLLLLTSLRTEHGFGLQRYAVFLSDAFHWKVIANTLSAAAWTTLCCLLLGYPTAVALARSRGYMQTILLVALILPLSVGVVVKAFAWAIVLRSDGVLNQTLLAIGAIDEPLRLIFTQTGLVFGATNIFLPFMVLPIYSVLKLIDPRLSAAGATLGASPLYRFIHITLPMSMSGVIAGIAFVFSLSVSMYVIPSLLIGERYPTLSTLTARSYLYLRDHALGSTSASILLIIAVAVVLASSLLGRRWYKP
ncbi:MAG: ABC transporter permease [Gammaproteobacteria bacterium]|nr:ABC transporter permease [Gammaproteobacteria bacterium]